MIFTPTKLNSSYTIELSPFSDSRGWFARTYCKNEFQQIGHNKEWVQLNHSATFTEGTIRGMHYQVKPFREIKMVRCIAGSVYDVIVDLREGSSTFLQWFGTELSAKNKKMLYIPEGFAHGFQTLSNDCELIYHHTEFYNPNAEAGIKYDEPLVNIQWPLQLTEISERDNNHPYLDINFKGI
ncbi:dTDP-4-dehydrorhamnose 3,5-epimerase [Panacibacter ginsenosidivorans]|uniref:dTDP-4-dehydrorhamnose 3,5-epimerase n=1 Tax=Panacibacter ginsenosidivorans TaxID=1813871 RepID=A0A5B8V454_9BACT|nr:dTDP-4-dehydrorhamnose 3,5-epimerase [Panacibacter ginsenosidivorans]QEC65959.1 dTDP-4-dehydrorhamnose 3,5-epimerase [Panacibacter ginsenosidivorans]